MRNIASFESLCLHRAARDLSEEDFIAFVNKFDVVTLSQALVIPDSSGSTLLHIVARNWRQSAAFLALIGKVSQAALDTALIIPDNYGLTALHIAAERQSEEAFIALVNNVDRAALNQALVTPNKNGETALYVASVCQSAEAFIALVENASRNALSEALVLSNRNGWTALGIAKRCLSKTSLACAKQSGIELRVPRHQLESFVTLISKVSQDALDTALIIPGEYGRTALHSIAQYHPVAFLALIGAVSQVGLDNALIIRDRCNETVLHLAAMNRYGSVAFSALIDKVSQHALDTALIMRGHGNRTALFESAEHQSERAFLALINKVSQHTLDTALIIPGYGTRTPLIIAAEDQSERAFMALVDKVGVAALSQALVITDEFGRTAMYQAVKRASGKILALIKKIDIETLNNVLSLVPERYSISDKRNYFVKTITLAMEQISASETLSRDNKNELFNKLRDCVALRRGKWRVGVGSYDYNRQLDRLKITINEHNVFSKKTAWLEVGEEEKSIFTFPRRHLGGNKVHPCGGMGLTNLLSPPIGLFEEKGGSEDEGEARAGDKPAQSLFFDL